MFWVAPHCQERTKAFMQSTQDRNIPMSSFSTNLNDLLTHGGRQKAHFLRSPRKLLFRNNHGRIDNCLKRYEKDAWPPIFAIHLGSTSAEGPDKRERETAREVNNEKYIHLEYKVKGVMDHKLYRRWVEMERERWCRDGACRNTKEETMEDAEAKKTGLLIVCASTRLHGVQIGSQKRLGSVREMGEGPEPKCAKWKIVSPSKMKCIAERKNMLQSTGSTNTFTKVGCRHR